MGVKTAAAMIVLNEADYLEYSVATIYDALDQIIIVEGAVEQVAEREATEDGLSLDGTTSIIGNLPDPENKIRYVHVGIVQNKVALRRAHNDLMDDDTDWVFVVDGDEAYTAEALDNTLRLINDNEDLVWVGAPFFNFVGDFWHLLGPQQKPKNFYPRPGMFQDRDGNFMSNGQYHERLYRLLPGVGYHQSHVCVQDSQGRHLYASGKYRSNRLYIPFENEEYNWIHYGFVRDRARFEAKLGFHTVRDKGKKYGDGSEKVDRRYVAVTTGELPPEDVKAGYRWEHVPDFEHPEPFKKHPYYDMTYEEIFALENDYLGRE